MLSLFGFGPIIYGKFAAKHATTCRALSLTCDFLQHSDLPPAQRRRNPL